MSLSINLHHLARHAVVLEGKLPINELEIETMDALIRLEEPLRYKLEVERLDHELLVRGVLHLTLHCQCVRCLKPFRHLLRLDDWVCCAPLAGEEAVVVVGDSVDLTPFLREDILLAFPQHPLCEPECPGLVPADRGKASTQRGAEGTECPSVWSTLDKLKL